MPSTKPACLLIIKPTASGASARHFQNLKKASPAGVSNCYSQDYCCYFVLDPLTLEYCSFAFREVIYQNIFNFFPDRPARAG